MYNPTPLHDKNANLPGRAITWWVVFWATTGSEDEQEDDQGEQARPRWPQSRPDPRQEFT